MKRNILIILLSIVTLGMSAQIDRVQLYEGLYQGMTKEEVKEEWKNNKEKYTSIDFGNGVEWRMYRQNMSYIDGNLTRLRVNPKGALMGLNYNNTKVYLNNTATVLKRMGYNVLMENPKWNLPEMFTNGNYMYGLLLINEEKTRVIHLYPLKISRNTYLPDMMIFSYQLARYEFELDEQQEETVIENLGF